MVKVVMRAEPSHGNLALLAAPIAGALFATSLIGFAAARTDGYSHATKAVSELGSVGAPSALAFNVLGFILPGFLLAWFGWSLVRVARNRTGPLLLVGSGLLTALAGLFPADLDNYRSATALGHVVGAIGSGVLWAAALLWMGPLLSKQFGLSTWGRLTPWFLLFLGVNFGWQVTFQMTGAVMPGWGQRIGFLGFFLWFGVTGILLWRQRTGPGQA